MKSQTLPVAGIAAAILSSSCFAAMNGVCASVRTVGGYTLVDMYATFSNAGDRLQGITLRELNTSTTGGFVQGMTSALKGWAPDPLFTSTHDSLDRFFTLGESTYGDPSGQTYANLSVFPAFFPVGTWIGSPPTPASNSLALEVDCGWFTDSSDTNNGTVDLTGLQGRINVHGSGATSQYGTWFAHLVIAGTGPATVNIGDWNATWFTPSGSIPKYAPNRLNSSFTVPAPGALALLATVGAARRRLRR